MNRRSFFAWLGLAPIVPLAAVADVGVVPSATDDAFRDIMASKAEVIRHRGDYTLMTDGIWHRPEFPDREQMDTHLRWLTKQKPGQRLYQEMVADDGWAVVLEYDPSLDRWAKYG